MNTEMENQPEENKQTSAQTVTHNLDAVNDDQEQRVPAPEPEDPLIVNAGDNKQGGNQTTSAEMTPPVIKADDAQSPKDERKFSAFEIADVLDDFDFLEKINKKAYNPMDRFPPMW